MWAPTRSSCWSGMWRMAWWFRWRNGVSRRGWGPGFTRRTNSSPRPWPKPPRRWRGLWRWRGTRGRRDPLSLVDRVRCRQWLYEFFLREIGPALKSRLTEPVRREMLLVGTGGTTTILARMLHQMTDFNRERIEGTRLSRAQVLDYMVALWSQPLAARKQIPGLPPNRADVILMGVAIYEVVMQQLDL